MLFHKIHFYLVRNNPCFVPLGKQSFDGLAAPFTVIQCQVIYPHGNKPVCQLGLHVACKLHRISKRIRPVVKRELNAAFEPF